TAAVGAGDRATNRPSPMLGRRSVSRHAGGDGRWSAVENLDAAAAHERLELFEQLTTGAHLPLTPKSERASDRAARTLDRVLDEDGAWTWPPGRQHFGETPLERLGVRITRPLQDQAACLLLTDLIELRQPFRGQ